MIASVKKFMPEVFVISNDPQELTAIMSGLREQLGARSDSVSIATFDSYEAAMQAYSERVHRDEQAGISQKGKPVAMNRPFLIIMGNEEHESLSGGQRAFAEVVRSDNESKKSAPANRTEMFRLTARQRDAEGMADIVDNQLFGLTMYYEPSKNDKPAAIQSLVNKAAKYLVAIIDGLDGLSPGGKSRGK